MNPFEKILDEEKVLVGDGAMGTELQKKGLDSGEAPEKWNLDHPEKITGTHNRIIHDKI